MNIFLFGATGGTGKEILIKLLEQKHQVFALARNPEALNIANDNLKIIKGSIYNPETATL
ncbi:NAD(P)H-binding protein [Myroides injenensis]|uniref:NAD(P)H-binding protein n=1 Tax=Myroides injenensis TaxID=1183151 RepID=UPI000287FE42|nr:NAD(P)H-binding protein [Myroides injenensis]